MLEHVILKNVNARKFEKRCTSICRRSSSAEMLLLAATAPAAMAMDWVEGGGGWGGELTGGCPGN